MIATIKRFIQYVNASAQQKAMIADYLDNKRFMSRYHNGAKKEVVKVKKVRKQGVTGGAKWLA